MSCAKGPGWCHKAMWWGNGMPAGCCDEPAYGPTRVGWEGTPLPWACPGHGGPPDVPETRFLRESAMKRSKKGEN